MRQHKINICIHICIYVQNVYIFLKKNVTTHNFRLNSAEGVSGSDPASLEKIQIGFAQKSRRTGFFKVQNLNTQEGRNQWSFEA